MPAVKDALMRMGKDTIGMVEKAVIVISDSRGLRSQETIMAELKKESANPSSESMQRKEIENPQNVKPLDPKMEETKRLLNKEEKRIEKEDMRVRKLYVQFNPNSLQLTAHGNERIPQFDLSKGGEGVKTGTVNGHIDLNVQLIFDRVNNQDAFMNEKFVANPTAIAKGIGTGIYHAAKGKSFEVQTEVEGLLGALNCRYTRSIEFIWGNLLYRGRLNTVNANYTMFNISGQPVRATVDLSLVCNEKASEKGVLELWDARYRAAFTRKGISGDTRGKQLQNQLAYQQKVQNILNL